MMYNIARLHEAITEAIPDQECLVFRERRYSWREVTDRTRQLANVLVDAGLGCHRERSELRNWESGQDHIGLYLHNGNEYLEAMLGAFKARCAPFNVNYRYVEKELTYLFDNADARVIIYHAAFAPRLEKIRPQLTQVKFWIQVADDSGNALLPGALDYEQLLASASTAPPAVEPSPDDLFLMYTGGTTGMPKSVMWRNEDVYLAALTVGSAPATLEELQERVKARSGIRALFSPPFMHGASQWGVFGIWLVGGTVIVQSIVDQLDADDIWSTIDRERVKSTLIVGDAYARPMIDQLQKKKYDLSSLSTVTSSGVIFTPALKQQMLDQLPDIRIIDAVGASEAGPLAKYASTRGDGSSTGDFRINDRSVVLSDDLSGVLEAGCTDEGWLASHGHVPLGYYGDEEKTLKTFPVVDGVRYSVPGDRATLETGGQLTFLGRDSLTINSGGEKIFVEEVELALMDYPPVYDTVVCGTPSEKFGSQVTALVQLRDGVERDVEAIKAHVRNLIAGYKVPRDFIFVESIKRAPSGKADYRWARATALKMLGIDST